MASYILHRITSSTVSVPQQKKWISYPIKQCELSKWITLKWRFYECSSISNFGVEIKKKREVISLSVGIVSTRWAIFYHYLLHCITGCIIIIVTNSLSHFSVSQCLSQERNSATVCLLPLLCCCRYCCHSDSQPSRLRLQWTFPQKTASLPASDRGKGVSLRDKCIYMFSTPLPHMEVRGSQSYLFALILFCFLFANGQSSKLETGSEQH